MDNTAPTPPKTVLAPEALGIELTIDINLLAVYTAVWGVDLDRLDHDELIAVVTNVARASYSRGYGDGCEDEASRLALVQPA